MDEETEAERFNYVTNLLEFDCHELNAHYDDILNEVHNNPDDPDIHELFVLVGGIGKFLHGDDFIRREPNPHIKITEKKLELVVDNTC